MDQRSDDTRVADAQKSENAEPYRRVEEMLAIVQQPPCRQAGCLDDIGEKWSHQIRGDQLRAIKNWGRNVERQVIDDLKSGDGCNKIKLHTSDPIVVRRFERFLDLVRLILRRSSRESPPSRHD